MSQIAAICPTFNRVAVNKPLLEEAVESFLRQTYTDAVLYIVNDNEHQEIRFNHPRVVIFNWCNRACTLGEKYNQAIRMTTEPLICGWEDDDLSLPHRLEYSVEKINGYEYFNPLNYWFLTDRLHHEHSRGICHNASIFTREAFNQVGGYDHTTGNQDALMDRKLRQLNTRLGPIPFSEASYIYRFGNSDLHLSGQRDPQLSYDKYSNRATKVGAFWLRPHWKSDYSAMVKKYISDKALK